VRLVRIAAVDAARRDGAPMRRIALIWTGEVCVRSSRPSLK
jgi:hypothetical protein